MIENYLKFFETSKRKTEENNMNTTIIMIFFLSFYLGLIINTVYVVFILKKNIYLGYNFKWADPYGLIFKHIAYFV